VLAAKCELLSEHLDVGIEVFQKYFVNTKYMTFIKKRTGIKNPEEALKAMILLHDVAKGYDEYQERIKTNRGFPKHEYYSAAIAGKVLLNIDIFLRDTIQLSIIWHHMAMRGPRLIKDIRSWDKFKAPKELNLRNSNDLKSLISYLCKKWNINIINVKLLPNSLTFNEDIVPLVKQLDDRLKSFKKGLNLYLNTIIFLRILTLCDNITASKNRGNCQDAGWMPIFLRDLPHPDDILDARNELMEFLNNIRVD